MKNHLSISKLSKKRQKNVQEQNFLTEDSIRTSAVWFRESSDYPKVLIDFFKEKGVNFETDILSWHDRMPFGGPSEAFRGKWVTIDGSFFDYEVAINEKEKNIEWYEWEDITNETEINEHKPGTGKTYGFLCLNLLRDLNNS